MSDGPLCALSLYVSWIKPVFLGEQIRYEAKIEKRWLNIDFRLVIISQSLLVILITHPRIQGFVQDTGTDYSNKVLCGIHTFW